MCCGGSYYPSELGIRISKLKPGDEIIVLKSEGYPAVLNDTTTIVWMVKDFFALCIDGTVICELYNSDIIVTGNHNDDFTVSEAAKQRELEDQKLRQQWDLELFGDPKPDWSERGTFPTEPE